MDYADIYYLDPRNAGAVIDHRTPTGVVNRVPIRPTATVQAHPAAMMAPASAITPQYPYPMYPPTYPQYPQYIMGNPVMGNPAYGGNFGNLGAIVNGLGGVGTLVDIVAQVFAAVMPLPAAPTPVGDAESSSPTDTNTNTNTKNLITYQSALASYAKRDEQIRTIGSLIKKLVG